MKKVFIGIFVFFCIIINASFAHTLTVNDFNTQVGEGRRVSAVASQQKIFISWTATGITLTPEQVINKTITFVMPDNDVVLVANYEQGLQDGVFSITTIEDEGAEITGLYSNYRCSECGATDHECQVVNIIIEADNAVVVEGEAGLYTITVIEDEGANVIGGYSNHKCSVCGGKDHECEVVNIFI